MKAGLLVRPKNLVAAPIGQIHKLRLADLNNSCPAVIETGIVFSDHGIVCRNRLQFGARGYATGNNRIGKYHASVPALHARGPEACRKGDGRFQEGLIGRHRRSGLGCPPPRRNASHHESKKGDAAYDNAAESSTAPPPVTPATRMVQRKSPADTCNPITGEGLTIQLSLQLPCQSVAATKKVSTSIVSRYLPSYSCASYQSRKKVAHLLSVDISYSS